MNNKLIDRMSELRRDGFTMKAIAAAVGVSERTVRRYVRGVEPEIKMPSELNSDEFTNYFYDKLLASRRDMVATASEHWAERFEFRVETVDAAMKSLQKVLDGMERVSIRKLESDEALRAEFFSDFMAQVRGDWARELYTTQAWRNMVRASRGYKESADLGDLGPRK